MNATTSIRNSECGIRTCGDALGGARQATSVSEFRIPNSAFASRRGNAPLELMVAMPLIVWMIAMIFNAGAGGVATADATIAARADAFRKAAAHTTPTERLFFLSPELAQSDIVSTSATRSRPVPPALARSVLVGQARLAVFNNVWDRRELPLNDPVHIRLIGQAVAGATLGQGLGAAGAALDQLQSAGSQGRGTFDEMSRRAQELQQETDAVKQGRQQEAAERRENAKKAEGLRVEAAAERKEIDRINGEIRAQEQAREKAKQDLKDDEAALEAREKEIDEKIKALEAERAPHDTKLKRLEGEISLLEQAS